MSISWVLFCTPPPEAQTLAEQTAPVIAAICSPGGEHHEHQLGPVLATPPLSLRRLQSTLPQ